MQSSELAPQDTVPRVEQPIENHSPGQRCHPETAAGCVWAGLGRCLGKSMAVVGMGERALGHSRDRESGGLGAAVTHGDWS